MEILADMQKHAVYVLWRMTALEDAVRMRRYIIAAHFFGCQVLVSPFRLIVRVLIDVIGRLHTGATAF